MESNIFDWKTHTHMCAMNTEFFQFQSVNNDTLLLLELEIHFSEKVTFLSNVLLLSVDCPFLHHRNLGSFAIHNVGQKSPFSIPSGSKRFLDSRIYCVRCNPGLSWKNLDIWRHIKLCSSISSVSQLVQIFQSIWDFFSLLPACPTVLWIAIEKGVASVNKRVLRYFFFLSCVYVQQTQHRVIKWTTDNVFQSRS